MESYTDAEEFIINAWGKPPGFSTVEERIDFLLNQGIIRGNDIIVLVRTALNREEE
jgi:hypothetical protein